MIHRVKGFGIVNKAKTDIFLELSCFFTRVLGSLKYIDIYIDTYIYIYMNISYIVVVIFDMKIYCIFHFSHSVDSWWSSAKDLVLLVIAWN